MANNRIMLVNNITKKFICLGKHLGGPWHLSHGADDLEAFLNDEKNQEAFWENERCYELKYENDSDFHGINFPPVE